jgi:hypothetical protein
MPRFKLIDCHIVCSLMSWALFPILEMLSRIGKSVGWKKERGNPDVDLAVLNNAE